MREEQRIYLALGETYRRKRRTRAAWAAVVCVGGGLLIWFGVLIPMVMRWTR